jgi:intracellular sulfur oxidation DsrE/DsrF family protein
MNGDPRFTDEELNRFIDGELDDRTSSRLEDRLEREPALAARVRQYRSVDQAVREAFDRIEPPVGHRPRASSRPGRRGIAAAALLLPAGILAGWLGHSLLGVSEPRDPLAGGVNLPVQGRQHLNTVLHLDVDEQAVMAGVLDRAEAILAAYAGQGVQVEVVANAAGLNLLRADTSVYARRVHAMMDKYPNLTFVACANSIRRLREQGVDVLLIDRTHARETAIDHIVDRLRDGWTYIKI